MNAFPIGLLAAVAAIGIAAAAPAGADLVTDNSAADTVSALQQQGYSVQLNGPAEVPLTQCRVTGVHGVPDSDPSGADPVRSTTVYLDISCPSDN